MKKIIVTGSLAAALFIPAGDGLAGPSEKIQSNTVITQGSVVPVYAPVAQPRIAPAPQFAAATSGVSAQLPASGKLPASANNAGQKPIISSNQNTVLGLNAGTADESGFKADNFGLSYTKIFNNLRADFKVNFFGSSDFLMGTAQSSVAFAVTGALGIFVKLNLETPVGDPSVIDMDQRKIAVVAGVVFAF
jgi:hypothetical protein